MNITNLTTDFNSSAPGIVETSMTDISAIALYCDQIQWSIMIYYILFFLFANVLLWSWLYEKIDEKQYIRFVTMFLRIFCFATALMLIQGIIRLF